MKDIVSDLESHFYINKIICLNSISIFRPAVLTHGMWDQIRTDMGKEFYLMLFAQDLLSQYRRNTNRLPYIQTNSKQVGGIFFKTEDSKLTLRIYFMCVFLKNCLLSLFSESYCRENMGRD